MRSPACTERKRNILRGQSSGRNFRFEVDRPPPADFPPGDLLINMVKETIIIYVAPYSRPVPYSRHPPYSCHFFNDTHENDGVWALFPIAVSVDHFSTQVCQDILSILSIFFGEASWRYHAKLFSPDVSLFHWTLLFLKSRINSRWCRSFFPCLFGLKLPYIEHFPLFLPPFLCQLAQESSLALDHEYYAPTRKAPSR